MWVKSILKRLLLIALMFVVLINLTGCGNKKKEEDTAREKIDEEIEYLDKRIVSMMNILNNVSFTNYKVVSENVKEQKTNDESSSKENSNNTSGSDTGSNSGESSSSSQSDISAEKGKGEEKNGDNEQNENKNMLYKLTENNILDSNSNNEVQWNEVKKEVENVYTLWTTIIIDMKEAKIQDNDISQFSKYLDELAISVKNEDKQESLKNLSELYNILPVFLGYNSSDTLKIGVYKTKAYILKAYYMASTDENWKQIQSEIDNANNEFRKVEENGSIDKNKKQNITKIGMLIKDFYKSVDVEDREIFFLRYKNVMQELNTL